MRRALALLVILAAMPLCASESPFGGPGASAAAASGTPFHPEVAAAPDTVAAGETAELRVVLPIPAGHYVYAERTRFEVLPSAAVEVLAVNGPMPETKHDPFLEEDVQVHEHDVEFVARLRFGAPANLRVVLSTQGCSSKFCYFPQSDTLAVRVAMVGTAAAPVAGGGATRAGQAADSPEARLHAAANRGLLWLLLLAFGAGVAASLTPCVYPMIPITIGIIGARSVGRRSKGFTLSLLYVLGIALVYSGLGTVAALTRSLFGGLLQNPFVVGGVALVFVAMAFSMFGAFEMQVPMGLAGRMSRVQGSGYPGAFLLGLVAGVVASPCIAPVLAAMLTYVATSGNPFLGFALFFSFALGLGVLFVVLGTFTGLVASLPKSGGWMTWIKIGFGILFLGVALYYLHPFLPHGRWLWPVGLGLLALGLALGALRAIDAAEPAPLRWRKALGRAALVAGLYAMAVPVFAARSGKTVPGPAWLGSESAGLERARAEARPMLVDFSADWCAACKELERYTFSDPRVIELAGRFVSVRVDATRSTPEIDALTAKYGIRGLPWVAFVRPDGTILQELTVTGFIDADAMLARMERARLAGPTAGEPRP